MGAAAIVRRHWIRRCDAIRYARSGIIRTDAKGPHVVDNLTLYIILGVVALIIISIIVIYNGLVAKRQTVNEAFSGIDVQLKLRRELIPNLVETVKGYAAHEKSTLDAVIAARTAAPSPKFTEDRPADVAVATVTGVLSSGPTACNVTVAPLNVPTTLKT